MNKSDVKIVVIIILLAGFSYIIFNLVKENGNTAFVYYEDKIILTIDLNINKEYVVQGLLGDVVIEVKDKNIRVKEESSPKHLCSLQGYTDSSSKPIICLPNKIVIKVGGGDDIDGVVY